MASQFEITSIHEADVPQLQGLFRAAGLFVAERDPFDYWLYARLYSNSCLAARKDDILIGTVLAFRDQSRNFKEMYVQDLAVAPATRRQGVARALMQTLLERADSWGIARTWLTSHEENAAATNLWRQLGFIPHLADNQEHGLWRTGNLQGPGRNRIVFIRE